VENTSFLGPPAARGKLAMDIGHEDMVMPAISKADISMRAA
jgi:hypothetical protein